MKKVNDDDADDAHSLHQWLHFPRKLTSHESVVKIYSAAVYLNQLFLLYFQKPALKYKMKYSHQEK